MNSTVKKVSLRDKKQNYLADSAIKSLVDSYELGFSDREPPIKPIFVDEKIKFMNQDSPKKSKGKPHLALSDLDSYTEFHAAISPIGSASHNVSQQQQQVNPLASLLLGKLDGKTFLDRLKKKPTITVDSNNSKKVRNEVYMTRRKSLTQDKPADTPNGSAIENQVKISEDDDNVVLKRDAVPHHRRGRQLSSGINTEGLNLIICEVMMIAEIKEYLVNRKTLDLLDIQLARLTGMHGINRLEPSLKKFNRMQTKKNDDAILNSRLAVKKVHSKEDNKVGINKLSQKSQMDRAEEAALLNRHEVTKGLHGSYSQSVRLLDVYERLNGYVPIVLFLTVTFNMIDHATKLIYYDPKLIANTGEKDPTKLLLNEKFLAMLVSRLLEFDEYRIFDVLLRETKNWDVMFSDNIINQYLQQHKIDYMVKFLDKFNEFIAGNRQTPMKSVRRSIHSQLGQRSNDRITSEDTKDPTANHLPSIISKDKIIMIIRRYFDNIESNDLILNILENLNFDSQEIVDLLLTSGEEDRVTQIIEAHPQLAQFLRPEKIVEFQMYKVLLTIEPMQLINEFNKATNRDKESSPSLYQELCLRVLTGQRIQTLCFIVLHVDNTFWDYDKLWKFYQSVNEVLRFESKNQWLASVDNPLLFCIRLAYFFKMTDRLLDINSKEINKLCEDLVKFCVCYIKNSSEETLILHFFDHDADGLDFLEYAFRVKKMEPFSVDFVTKVIYNMWDLGRHSKQPLFDFFRLAVFKKEAKEVNMGLFKRNYDMPIEPTDVFQIDYYLTSRSVYLKVLSELFWPYTLIAVEFTFSMYIVSLYLDGSGFLFNQSVDWISQYYNDYPIFSLIHFFLRLSFILSTLSKVMIIRQFGRKGFYVRYFHYITLFVSFLQLFVVPFMLHNHFWVFNNLQMMFVLAVISYTFYLGLSLNWMGVILRIFARMVYVVVLFGVTSVVVITVVAYPLHTIFIGFSQPNETNVPPFPDLNMFRSLYNGVLTLFEFTFGAVVFVRPYPEQNSYTYATTFIMVIMSFFGNIMLANMLIAFLANQFDIIMDKAKYYTLRMQFSLIKMYQTPEVDSLHALPYFFVLPFSPLFAFMIPRGKGRRAVNKFFKNVTHISNVLIPNFIYYMASLLVLLLVRYFFFIVKTFFAMFTSPIKLLYLLMWIAAGPVLLFKLYVQDLYFIYCRIAAFDDAEDDDLFIITLNDHEREQLVFVFEKVYNVGQRIIREINQELEKEGTLTGPNNPIKRTITLNKFIYEISLSYPKEFSSHRHKEKEREVLHTDDSKMDEDPAKMYNRNKYIFSRKYKTDGGARLYRTILKKFLSFDDKAGNKGASNMEIDLDFLVEKFRNNLNIDNIHLLLSFDKSNLEQARMEMRTDDDIEMRSELSGIKNKLDDLSQDILTLIGFVSNAR